MPRKLPELTPDSVAFWRGGETGALNIHFCLACEKYFHPPAPICPKCLSAEVGPRRVSGRGSVFAFTINHQAWTPELHQPYVIAIVELAEQTGLRFLTNIAGTEMDELKIGDRVQVKFEPCEDVWIPVFEREV